MESNGAEEKHSCRICYCSLNHHLYKIYEHPRINISLCGVCDDEIHENLVDMKDKSPDEYCIWCVDGGDLFLCDSCNHATCEICILNNFGKLHLDSIVNGKSWKCFQCAPESLGDLYYQNQTEENISLDDAYLLLDEIEDEILKCEEKIEELTSKANQNLMNDDEGEEDLRTLLQQWRHHEELIINRQLQVQDRIERDIEGNLTAFYLIRERDTLLREREEYEGEGEGDEGGMEMSDCDVEELGVKVLNKLHEQYQTNVGNVSSFASVVRGNTANSDTHSEKASEEYDQYDQYKGEEDSNTLQKLQSIAADDSQVKLFDCKADIDRALFPPEYLQKYPLPVLKAMHYACNNDSNYVKVLKGKQLDGADIIHFQNTYGLTPDVKVVCKYIKAKLPSGHQATYGHRGSVHSSIRKAIISSNMQEELEALQGRCGLASDIAEKEDLLHVTQESDLEYESGQSDHEVPMSSRMSVKRCKRKAVHLDSEDAILESNDNFMRHRHPSFRNDEYIVSKKKDTEQASQPAFSTNLNRSTQSIRCEVDFRDVGSLQNPICIDDDDENENNELPPVASTNQSLSKPKNIPPSTTLAARSFWTKILQGTSGNGEVKAPSPVHAHANGTRNGNGQKTSDVISHTKSSAIDDSLCAVEEFVINEGTEERRSGKNRKPAVALLSNISYHLKQHQKDAIRFMWSCIMGKHVFKDFSDFHELQANHNGVEASLNKINHYEKKVEKQKTELGYGKGGCILAHCMGLGKSFSVIALLITLLTDINVTTLLRNPFDSTVPLIRRALIIAPVNTIFNWNEEFIKWTPPALLSRIRVTVVHSEEGFDRRVQKLKVWYDMGGVCIIGYELLRDSLTLHTVGSRGGEVQRLKFADCEKYLLEGPDIVIADEAHRIKDKTSKLSELINRLKTKRRIAMTGSPLQNNLMEYFHMIQFVKSGSLGSEQSFRRTFLDPITAGESKDASAYEKKKMKGRIHVLRKKVKDIIQRKDVTELQSELPHKREFIIVIKMTSFQKYLYKRFIDIFLKSGKQNFLFRAYQTLLRIWNHPSCLSLNMLKEKSNCSIKVSLSMLKNQLLGRYNLFLKECSLKQGVTECMDLSQSIGSDAEDEENGDVIITVVTHDHDRISDSDSSDDDSCVEFIGNATAENKADLEKLQDCKDVKEDIGIDSREAVSKVLTMQRPLFELNACSTANSVASITENRHDWWYEPSTDVMDQKLNSTKSINHNKLNNTQTNTFTDKEFSCLGSKISLLLSLLAQCAKVQEKMVVFSQSLPTLDFIEMVLNSNWDQFISETSSMSQNKYSGRKLNHWSNGFHYERLDGKDSSASRAKKIQDFQNLGNRMLFLISTKAGNMGINLQCANRVVIFDSSWNPAHDLQAQFRCYRFGQTKNVFVYRFLAGGTMEEKIYKKQVRKLSLSLRVVDEHMPENQFSSKEVEELLGYASDDDKYQVSDLYEKDDGADESGGDSIFKNIHISEDVDIVLHNAIKENSSYIHRVYDMDPLLEDKECEHLNEMEQEEAERIYDQEQHQIQQFQQIVNASLQSQTESAASNTVIAASINN